MASSPLSAPAGPQPRRTLGKYEVLCRLSTGGMSEIFLAFQRGLGGFQKVVVLKSILPDIRGEEEFVRMFLHEARITAAFNHPNIAQVYDLDVDEGELFLAMEFVPGCTLVEVARACRQLNEPIPIGFTLMSVRDTALALHYAHTFTDPLGRKQTVIHRDVAEKNIMVTYEGVTKLLDFGIAKSLNRTERTTIGTVKGTSGYMSPEQILGEKVDARSDIFSLGVVLHECLTGMRLFHGKNPEDALMAALREDVAPPSRQNPEVPDEVDAVVLRALARNREDRFSTALELARELEQVAGSLIWLPENSGELVQRLFADRRDQTRKLLEDAQVAMGEVTSEHTLQGLLGLSQSPQRLSTPQGIARAQSPSLPPAPPNRPITEPPIAPRPALKIGPVSAPEERLITETPTPLTRPDHHATRPIPQPPSDEEERTALEAPLPEAPEADGAGSTILDEHGPAATIEEHGPAPSSTPQRRARRRRRGVPLNPVKARRRRALTRFATAVGLVLLALPVALYLLGRDEPHEVTSVPTIDPNFRRPTTDESAVVSPAPAQAQAPETTRAEPVPEADVLEAGTRHDTLEATTPPSPPPRMVSPGQLTLVAEPWAHVFTESNESLGETPIHKINLPPGRHRLKLRAENEKVHILSVEIRAGELTRIQVGLNDLPTE